VLLSHEPAGKLLGKIRVRSTLNLSAASGATNCRYRDQTVVGPAGRPGALREFCGPGAIIARGRRRKIGRRIADTCDVSSDLSPLGLPAASVLISTAVARSISSRLSSVAFNSTTRPGREYPRPSDKTSFHTTTSRHVHQIFEPHNRNGLPSFLGEFFFPPPRSSRILNCARSSSSPKEAIDR